MAALSATGIPSDQFMFLGFIPRSGSDRTRWLETIRQADIPVVFFEAPHRIRRTIDELTLLLVNKPIYIHRELSKIHEEFVIQPKQIINETGEFVVVIGPPDPSDSRRDIEPDTILLAAKLIDYLTKSESLDNDEASLMAAKALSQDPRALRRAVKKARFQKRRDEDQLP